jgi:GH25 family lysozyme M1 (1,4-beta-N-acetylmuramidase)
MPINLRVVDIYWGDKVTSFQKAADWGLWGVIHKATTGATGKDNVYANRRKAARDAGLLWGAYHWGTAAKISDQVDNFLNSAKPDGDTLVALDFEETAGNQMTIDQAEEFLTLIERRLHRKAIIYGGGLLKTVLGHRPNHFFGGHRLWLAHYNPNPVCHPSWQKFWLWQYTDKRGAAGLQPDAVDGIPGNSQGFIDCDSYDGTRDQLKTEWAA